MLEREQEQLLQEQEQREREREQEQELLQQELLQEQGLAPEQEQEQELVLALAPWWNPHRPALADPLARLQSLPRPPLQSREPRYGLATDQLSFDAHRPGR